jgi:oxaloacetate decarboxylase gamma subunit
MIIQSTLLLVVGMTTVLLFLIVLVGLINILKKATTSIREKELADIEAASQAERQKKAKLAAAKKSKGPNADELVVALSAAVHKFRTNN